MREEPHWWVSRARLGLSYLVCCANANAKLHGLREKHKSILVECSRLSGKDWHVKARASMCVAS